MSDTTPPFSIASGVIRQKVLVRMRWFAVFAQAVAFYGATRVLGLEIDEFWPGIIIAASALFNLVAMVHMHRHPHLQSHGAALWLGFDMVQLALLMHVTGGLSNPFAVLLFAPMVAGAALLPDRSVFFLTTLGLALLTMLLSFSKQLDWPHGELPPLYLMGSFIAMVATALFLVLYVRKVAREARQLSDALSNSRIALAREQRISAFGALAAAVAHELGSPLSTIAVIAKDMQHSVKGELAEDVTLLNQQIERCRSILSDFARHGLVENANFEMVPLTDWIYRIAEPYEREDIEFRVWVSKSEGPSPRWPMQLALIHGVANPLQNAFSYARERVSVEINWDGDSVSLFISDDGPGFPPHLLENLGEYDAGGRDEKSGHMGLGLFIAKALLERSGANVHFSNLTHGEGMVKGALVVLEWQQSPT